MQYTDAIVKKYEERNQKENFKIKDLKWFANINDINSYYKSISYKQMIDIQTNSGKNIFYERVIFELNNLEKYG